MVSNNDNDKNDLGREKILLLTAIFGFAKVIFEIVIKIVSYARSVPKLRLSLQ